jgi:DNA polymerase I-like protein with 3'-5' exonuclease and polymerase domains/uracil-DNA glycosylase
MDWRSNAGGGPPPWLFPSASAMTKSVEGARCEVCPLRDCEGPVEAEANLRAKVVVVGEAPGEHEVREGRPFVGPAGKIITSAARKAGLQRRDIHWTNACLCRPPNNDMGRLLDQVRKQNRVIEKENKARLKVDKSATLEPSIPTPMACCSPRLWAELEPYTDIIAAGGTAVKTVVGQSASIMSLRGGPIELERNDKVLRVLPTVHPAFVMRAKRWTHVFHSDLHKAARWFRGELRWEPPKVFYNPSPSELETFLSDPKVPYWTYDVETDSIECLTAELRCIAIGTAEAVVVVGFQSIENALPFYPAAEMEKIRGVLCSFFADSRRLKAGHNSGYYDRLVVENQLGVTPEPNIDTMLLHRLTESELPHNLGFVGSLYTDVPSWKTDREGKKKAKESETDRELHEYCAYDVAVTAAVLPPLFEQVRLRDQEDVLACDSKLQTVCAGMHKAGMYVDQQARLEWEGTLTQRINHHRSSLQTISGAGDMNPGSVLQIRTLLFDRWHLEPPVEDKIRFTKAGDPSTSDDVLRSCLTIRTLTEAQREAIKHIRHYRKSQKLLGTYVTKLRYDTQDAYGGWDVDDDERKERKEAGDIKLGIVVSATGRMHPGYNAHVTTSGRLSSSRPINAQNFPFKLRNMVIAAPGNVLVGADADQIDLRIAASRWNSATYLQAFDDGLDPHSSVTALAVFGNRFVEAAGSPAPWRTGTKFKGDAKKLRDLSKRVQYASQYWASTETVHRVITQTETENEDGTTSLPYLRISMREVRMMHAQWMEGARFERGWEQEIATWRTQGFLTEPVMGRRRDFLDGENPNEIVNFPIQGAAASLMNIAIIRLAEEIPFAKWGPGTGIINQCHDSLIVECPESEGPRVAKLLEDCMNFTHPGLPGVTFTAEAAIGHAWTDV